MSAIRKTFWLGQVLTLKDAHAIPIWCGHARHYLIGLLILEAHAEDSNGPLPIDAGTSTYIMIALNVWHALMDASQHSMRGLVVLTGFAVLQVWTSFGHPSEQHLWALTVRACHQDCAPTEKRLSRTNLRSSLVCGVADLDQIDKVAHTLALSYMMEWRVVWSASNAQVPVLTLLGEVNPCLGLQFLPAWLCGRVRSAWRCHSWFW